ASVYCAGVNPSISAVRLLSNPQQRQASATTTPARNDPTWDGAASTAPATKTAPTALQALAPRCSRKNAQASTAVVTTSRFNQSETDAAGAPERPTSKSTGPTAPPNRTAPRSRPRFARPRRSAADPPRK